MNLRELCLFPCLSLELQDCEVAYVCDQRRDSAYDNHYIAELACLLRCFPYVQLELNRAIGSGHPSVRDSVLFDKVLSDCEFVRLVHIGLVRECLVKAPKAVVAISFLQELVDLGVELEVNRVHHVIAVCYVTVRAKFKRKTWHPTEVLALALTSLQV